jgi:hypothetical protein
MFLLIRPKKARYTRASHEGAFGTLLSFPIGVLKMLLKEYGMVGAGIGAVFLFEIFGRLVNPKTIDWHTLFLLGKTVGFSLLALVQIFFLFVRSSKKHD